LLIGYCDLAKTTHDVMVKDYTMIGARFRRYRIGYVRWMGLITVQVNSIQLKADMGSKEPSYVGRKRGKRGSRNGKARARRQTSLQPEISGPPLKHSSSDGLRPRYAKRQARLLQHAYLFFSRWYEMKKRIDRKEDYGDIRTKDRFDSNGMFIGRKAYTVLGTQKRLADLHQIGVDLVRKGRYARQKVDRLRKNLSFEDFLLRKNEEWYRVNIKVDTDEPPLLVDVNAKRYAPPDPGSGPGVLKLECPSCGFRRASALSKCRCGYVPVRAAGPTRTGKTAGFLVDSHGRPVGSKAPKTTRRGFR